MKKGLAAAFSGVAAVALRRRKTVVRLEARNHDSGRLDSPQLWSQIQHEGYNVEADAAWSWLIRERRHARADRRARARIRKLRRKLERPPASGRVGRAARRLARGIRGRRRAGAGTGRVPATKMPR